MIHVAFADCYDIRSLTYVGYSLEDAKTALDNGKNTEMWDDEMELIQPQEEYGRQGRYWGPHLSVVEVWKTAP